MVGSRSGRKKGTTINLLIDYDFSSFSKTMRRDFEILNGFADKAGMTRAELQSLFKGEGFSRLVMAGGGVPRDVMSLFLEIMAASADGRIGKDEVRISSCHIPCDYTVFS